MSQPTSDAPTYLPEEEVVMAPESDGLLEHPAHQALLQKLTEAEQAATAAQDQWLRSQADIANIQQRTRREMETARKYALEHFARELLPAIDNLERSLEHATGDDVPLQTGIGATLKLLLGSCEKHHIYAINPEGEAFDPALHEAMSTENHPDLPANTVIKILQKGYRLHDRLLRPAMVIVSRP